MPSDFRIEESFGALVSTADSFADEIVLVASVNTSAAIALFMRIPQ